MSKLTLFLLFSLACCGVARPQVQAPAGPPTTGAAPPGNAAGGPPAPNPRTFQVDALFAALDANHDGEVSREEMIATGMTDRLFTFCDPDKNGRITLPELRQCKLPELMDMNHDGVLTLAEILAFEKTAAGHERGPGEPRPK